MNGLLRKGPSKIGAAPPRKKSAREKIYAALNFFKGLFYGDLSDAKGSKLPHVGQKAQERRLDDAPLLIELTDCSGRIDDPVARRAIALDRKCQEFHSQA